MMRRSSSFLENLNVCLFSAHAQFGNYNSGQSSNSFGSFGNTRAQAQAGSFGSFGNAGTQTRPGAFSNFGNTQTQSQSSFGNTRTQSASNSFGRQSAYQQQTTASPRQFQQPARQSAGSCRELNERTPIPGSCDRYVECVVRIQNV